MKAYPLLQVVILAAVMIASVAWQAPAQNVYSLNVVGYNHVTLSPGWNLMAVQLIPGANCDGFPGNYNANAVLTGPPVDGSLLYRFNPTNQSYYDAGTYLTGVGWYPLSGNTNDPVLNLPLGEGFFVWTPQSWTNTIVGEVPQGSLANPVPAGYSLKASMVPQAGLLSADLGFPEQALDQAWQWVSPAFSRYSVIPRPLGWLPTEPSLSVGEGFFIYPRFPETWVRNFTVQFSTSPATGSRTASVGSLTPPVTASLYLQGTEPNTLKPLVAVQATISGFCLQGTNAVLNINITVGWTYDVLFSTSVMGPWQIVATGQTATLWQESLRPGAQGYYELMIVNH
jgi:hypothetical protein